MAIALAQDGVASGAATGGSFTIAITVSKNTTSGNTLILAGAAGGDAITSVADSKGNTWAVLTQSNSFYAATIAYCNLSSVLLIGDTITVTFAASATPRAAIVSEWSGIASTTPLDKQSNVGNFTGGVETCPASGSLFTTTQASELAFAAVGCNWAASVSSIGSGWTSLTSVNPDTTHFIFPQYKILSATGQPQASWTLGGTPGTPVSVIGAFTGAASSAPANTVAPAVTGTTTVGQTLSTTNGTWTDAGGSVFTYQWQDSADGSTGWANIASATSQTYTIGSGELNKFIRCVVTDTDSTTQATAANSNVVGAIAAAPSLSTVAGKTGTSGTAVMQKAKSGWTYITGKKNTSGTAVDQKGLGGFTKIKGH